MELKSAVIIECDPESDWLVGSVGEPTITYTQAPTVASVEENVRQEIQVFVPTLSGQESQGPLAAFAGLQRREVAV